MPERQRKKRKAIQEYYGAILTHMPDLEIHERDMSNHITLRTVPDQIKYIQKYIGKTRQRKNIITNKIRARRAISRLLQQWHTRKLEHDARKLQKEADKGNIIPIWKYQIALKGLKIQDRSYVLNKTDGGKNKTPLGRQLRRTEWVKSQFDVLTEQEIPHNMHINEQTWKNTWQGDARKDIQNIPDELKQIRENSKLHTLMRENPIVEQRVT